MGAKRSGEGRGARSATTTLTLTRAQQALGFEVTIVPAEEDLSVRTERVLEAIDDTVAVVAFSHVLFRTSYIMDAAAIAKRTARWQSPQPPS